MDLVPIIAALAGALVGGLVSEMRIAFEGQRERNRVLNQLLHYQLEVLYSLQRLDPQELEQELAELFGTRFPEMSDQIVAGLRSAPGFMETLMAASGQHLPHGLVENYERSINGLSQVEPVLAYRLSSPEPVARIGNLLEQVRLSAEDAAADGSELQRLTTAVEPELYQVAAKKVREDINLLRPYLKRRHRAELGETLSKLGQRAVIRRKDDVEQFWNYMSGVADRAAAAGDTTLKELLALSSRTG